MSLCTVSFSALRICHQRAGPHTGPTRLPGLGPVYVAEDPEERVAVPQEVVDEPRELLLSRGPAGQ